MGQIDFCGCLQTKKSNKREGRQKSVGILSKFLRDRDTSPKNEIKMLKHSQLCLISAFFSYVLFPLSLLLSFVHILLLQSSSLLETQGVRPWCALTFRHQAFWTCKRSSGVNSRNEHFVATGDLMPFLSLCEPQDCKDCF